MRVLFKLRPGKSPVATIYLRIKVDGKIASDIATDIRINRADWDQAKQRITGRSLQANNDNLRLEQIKSDVHRLFLQHQDATAHRLAEYYKGKRLTEYFLPDLVDLYETDCRAEYDKWPTLRSYITRLRNIRQFIESKKLQKLKAEEITLNLADEFVRWMKAKGVCHQYIVRHTQVLKDITTGAVRREILKVDPLAVFKLKKKEVINTDHLTTAELRFLETYTWGPSLQKVVDLFVFSCYTSFHYKDLQTLQPSDVKIGLDNHLWLQKDRVKYSDSQFFTSRTQKVPLHPKALLLIEKYGGIQNLPKISNKKYNKDLKMVQQVASIEINLTAKVGRKTFTDILLNELHLSELAIAAMLGHSSTRMLKYYGQADDRRIAEEVKKAKWNEW